MFKKNYIITGNILCLTGLHIGNSGDSVDIGGSDSPIIRDPISNLPYIPGSSIKGKLRTLLELNDKLSSESVINNKGKPSTNIECVATQIFGVASGNDEDEKCILKYPTRIIVRDSFPSKRTKENWITNSEIIAGAELKYENTIDRIKSEANPRNIERIPKDSVFEFEIIFSVYDGDNNKNILNLLTAMKLLEDNYLGGSGSRGFGQITFEKINIKERDFDYYINGEDKEDLLINEDIDGAIKYFKEE